MVLGNTFHLMLEPGPELSTRSGACTASWAGTGRSSPTPAAFRSSRWATGRWRTRSRARARAARAARARCSSIEEAGVRFRSYVDGAERFMGPEDSMEVQAALHSDIALAFDECTPVPRQPRLHGALDGAHAPLARALPALARRARPRRPARLRHRPGRGLRGPAQGFGRRVRGRQRVRRHRHRRLARAAQGADVRGRGVVDAGPVPRATASRATCSASATSTTCCAAWSSAIDTFDCAMPTRLGRHGVAIVPEPEARWRVDLVEAAAGRSPRADPRGLRMPGLRGRLLAAPTCATCSRPASCSASGW